MKKNSFIFFVVLIFTIIIETSTLRAHKWEVGFIVCDTAGTPISLTLTVYRYNYNTGVYEFWDNGLTNGYFGEYPVDTTYCDINGAFDIGISDMVETPTINTLPYYGKFLVRIQNQYYKLEYSGSGGCGDILFLYQNGLSNIYNYSGYGLDGPHQWNNKELTLKNDFGGDRDSANVKGEMIINDGSVYDLGYTSQKFYSETSDFPHTLSAEDDQYIVTYYREWRRWENNETNLSQTLSSPDNYNKTATYARKCNLTVQNDFGASGTGGSIKFQSTQYNSPYQPSETYEDLTYSAEALSHTINSVSYTFSHWEFNSSNIGSSNPISAFQPTSHGTLKAKFNGKPINSYRSLTFNNGENGENIRLTWNKHPLDNSEITHYAIWRKVDKEAATQISTVNATDSATYTFTDNLYVISEGPDKVLLHYDVRAYYAPSSTYSDFDLVAIYGETYARMNQNQLFQEVALEIPSDYSINNYPNPFNPTTTIKYQLPEAGMVTIKVYDILGKEVAELVNEPKEAGYYEVNFSAKGGSASGGGANNLPSGIYIYTIRAGKYVESKKMILMK